MPSTTVDASMSHASRDVRPGIGAMKEEHFPRPQRTQIMTLAEIAKYLGLHEMTVYRMLKSGRLPGFKLGRQWRTKKDILDAWLLRQIDQQQHRGATRQTGKPLHSQPRGS